MKNVRAVFLSLILVCAVAANSWADDKKEIWSPTTPGPFTTFTAPLIKKNAFVVQPLYFFNIARGTFNGDGHYSSLPSKDYNYQQFIQLYTQYGLTERLEINAQPQWKINYAKESGVSAENAGFADFLMNIRYCGIDETTWVPRVTGMFQVKLPTGKYENPDNGKLLTDITGTGSTDYTYGFSFTKGVYQIRTLFHLDLLLTNVPSPVKIDGVKTEFNNTYIVNGAFEWIFYKDFNLLGELLWQGQGDARIDGNRTPDSGQSSLIFSTGIGYSKKNWQALIGYQRTLIGNNVNANDTVAGTVIVTF